MAMVMGFEGGGGVVFSKERENVGEDGVGCVVGPGSQGRFLFITLKKNVILIIIIILVVRWVK